ncbi:MFS transporter [Rhabdobacter roseus]|uniref:Sugar phosphate permease n=1 Tax=Rhabdobacter roseus TaxID=1655419 RepID=A0A840TMJ9_9BACT|nr:MFS transporter [Rhabdobacter roseus]MBB5285486.1 sugar phosphate permease [Rhabdobacter roseus]
MLYRYRVLTFLFSLSMITYLDRVCISVVGKRMKDDLDLTNEQFGWILGAFSLAYALFEVPTGALGDRVGPRRVLLRVVLWWSLFTALTGVASGLIALIVIRFLFGMGEAGAYPNSSIVIARWFPAVETGRAQAFIWAAGRLGGAVAPLVMVPLAASLGWRASFYTMGLVGVVWAVVWYYWFRDFPNEKKGVSEKELRYIEQYRRFRPQAHSLAWGALLRSRNLWALVIMFHFYMYGAYFFYSWMPIYLQEGRHFSEADMQLFTTLPFLSGAVGCFAGGFLSDWLVKRFGLRVGRASVGLVGMGLSSAVMWTSALTTDNVTAAYLLSLGMLFKDLTLPVSFAVCVDIGKSRAGTVAGTMNMIGQLGGFFLAVFFGRIVDVTGDYTYPLYIIGTLLAFSSLLWLVIDPTKELTWTGTPPTSVDTGILDG